MEEKRHEPTLKSRRVMMFKIMKSFFFGRLSRIVKGFAEERKAADFFVLDMVGFCIACIFTTFFYDLEFFDTFIMFINHAPLTSMD